MIIHIQKWYLQPTGVKFNSENLPNEYQYGTLLSYAHQTWDIEVKRTAQQSKLVPKWGLSEEWPILIKGKNVEPVKEIHNELGPKGAGFGMTDVDKSIHISLQHIKWFIFLFSLFTLSDTWIKFLHKYIHYITKSETKITKEEHQRVKKFTQCICLLKNWFRAFKHSWYLATVGLCTIYSYLVSKALKCQLGVLSHKPSYFSFFSLVCIKEVHTTISRSGSFTEIRKMQISNYSYKKITKNSRSYQLIISPFLH